MKLIVGLGNPGKEYARTRHNAGFLVLDQLQEKLGFPAWELSKKFNAEVSSGTIQEQKTILAKPMTFMNDSGVAVQLLAHFYKLAPRDIVAVHDDKDLPLGNYKIQQNRGSAGHQGVSSIIERIGSQDFTRVRLGIAPANPKKMPDAAKFVLGKFGLFEKKPLAAAIAKATEEIARLI